MRAVATDTHLLMLFLVFSYHQACEADGVIRTMSRRQRDRGHRRQQCPRSVNCSTAVLALCLAPSRRRPESLLLRPGLDRPYVSLVDA